MADKYAEEAGGVESPMAKMEAAKLGIWAFLGTEVLLFGGLFTAYTIFRVTHAELFHAEHLKLNKAFGAVNTVVLITSSLSAAISVAAARRNRYRQTIMALAATITLAAAFLGIKAVEYHEHFDANELPSTNIFFSLYYMMTGLHALHVIIGMAALSYVLYKAYHRSYSREYYTPVEISVIYWHFVDLVWIYLFPMLYLIG